MMIFHNKYVIGVGLIVSVLVAGGYWQSMPVNKKQDSAKISTLSFADNLPKVKAEASDREKTMTALLVTMKKIQRNVDGLTQQVGNVRTDIDRLSAKSNTAASDQLQHSEEEQLKIAEQQYQQQQASFENNFQAEQVDPQWSLATEIKTLDSLDQVSDRLTVLDFECKRSSCRLNLARAEGVIEDGSVFEAFETGVNWEGEMSVSYDPESGEGTAYLARPGYSLSPSFELEG